MKRILLIIIASLLAMSLNGQAYYASDTFGYSDVKVRLSVQGGLGYALGKIDESLGEDMANYQKSLKKGKSYGADLASFYSGYTLGVKYNRFNSSAKAYGTFTYDDGTTDSGALSDDIRYTFIGPYIGISSIGAESKHFVSMNYGLGYVGYEDYCEVITPFVLTGWTLGYYIGFQYDYRASKHLALGAEVSWISGSITKITKAVEGEPNETITLDKNEAQSVSHINALFGIRFFL